LAALGNAEVPFGVVSNPARRNTFEKYNFDLPKTAKAKWQSKRRDIPAPWIAISGN
jgi:hypothetical protein